MKINAGKPLSVTTYYLEMNDPSHLVPKKIANKNFTLAQVEIPLPELNRFFYTLVGRDWCWCDKLNWTEQQWREWVDRPDLQTWVAYLSGTPAGYFELERQAQENVEIAYFGLVPHFIGKGLGGALLTRAVEQAWQMNASRVWVHTCTLDSAAALSNYLARGFQVYRQKTHLKSFLATGN
jgi:GNAT superfamily N-acetyltransferase